MRFIDRLRGLIPSGKQKGFANMQILIAGAIGLVVAALTIGFGAQILGGINASMTNNSIESNATINGMTGLLNMSGQLGNIGLVLAAVVIIGLLVYGFGAFSGGMGGGRR